MITVFVVRFIRLVSFTRCQIFFQLITNNLCDGDFKLSVLNCKHKMSQPKNTVLKIGMLGDVQTGKTSLMVKYVKGKFDEDYIQTLGINLFQENTHFKGVQFLEKTIEISKTQTVTFMIWDLGGQKDFMSMLDLVCNDSVALFFIFDLTKIATLSSIRDWYVQSRKYNKVF